MREEVDIKNLRVDAYTTPCPICVGPDVKIPQVISLMEENSIRHLPVINENEEAIGIITDRDVSTVRSFAFSEDISAVDLMTPDPLTVSSGTSLIDAAFEMSEVKIGSLIVNDEHGRVMGIFTSTDGLNALVEVLRGEILEEE
jgi:acetoin utilization protein AcuB